MMLVNKYTLFLLMVIMLFSASVVYAIIPSADLEVDKRFNFEESAFLGNGYDLNIKLNNRLALGYKYYYSSFFSWDSTSLIYIKYLAWQGLGERVSVGLFGSLVKSEGEMGYGWFGMGGATSYKFSGSNFGPLVSLKLNDLFVLRGANIVHSISSSYASAPYPAVPFYNADPSGIEIACLINPNLELDIGLSRFGVIGLKVKI